MHYKNDNGEVFDPVVQEAIALTQQYGTQGSKPKHNHVPVAKTLAETEARDETAKTALGVAETQTKCLQHLEIAGLSPEQKADVETLEYLIDYCIDLNLTTHILASVRAVENGLPSATHQIRADVLEKGPAYWEEQVREKQGLVNAMKIMVLKTSAIPAMQKRELPDPFIYGARPKRVMYFQWIYQEVPGFVRYIPKGADSFRLRAITPEGWGGEAEEFAKPTDYICRNDAGCIFALSQRAFIAMFGAA